MMEKECIVSNTFSHIVDKPNLVKYWTAFFPPNCLACLRQSINGWSTVNTERNAAAYLLLHAE
jgi:hypothetical protein